MYVHGFFFSSRRRHTRLQGDWSSDVCSSDLNIDIALGIATNQNIYIVTILLGLTGLAGNAWHGIAYTEIAVVAGVRYSGRALGMIGTTVFTVSFVIPYIIPYILNVFSWSGVWVVVGIASLIALPLMNEFRRKKGVGINA